MHGWWRPTSRPAKLLNITWRTVDAPGAGNGNIEINGLRAQARDGVAVTQESVLRVTAIEDSEIVLVDLA
jgi:hypothetical protein